MTLLSQPVSFGAVQEMEEVGLFEVLFPELGFLKGTSQDRYHHLDVFQHSLLTFRCLEELMQKEIPLPEDLATETSSYLKQEKKTSWLKWAALFHDLGKEATEGERAGHRTFYGHAEASQKQFGLIARRYRLSNREKTCIDRMIGLHMQPLNLIQEDYKNTLTRRALIRFVKEAGEELNGILMLALADTLAARGKEKPEDMEDRLKDLWRRAISVRDEIIRPLEKSPPLISGNDLIDLGLPPGLLFKTLLSELQEEQQEGKISNREEALEWIKKKINL
jgi:poly(A) polymerase